MKRIHHLLPTLAFAVLASVALGQTFPANPVGRLLPRQADLPLNANQVQNGPPALADATFKNLAGSISSQSGGPIQSTITSTVYCGSNVVGSMFFQFGGTTGTNGNNGGGNPESGMLMRGGFTFAPGWAAAPGVTFAWTQAYKETLFNGTVNNSTVDSTGPSPLYPNFTVPKSAGAGNMVAGLFDDPADGNGSQFQSLDFESLLVCYTKANPMTLHAVGSFLWGYTHTGSQATGATGLSSDYALIFTSPITSLYTSAFNREYAGAGGTKGQNWTLDTNCMSCFQAVPEPPTLLILGGAFVPFAVALPFRRKRCRTSQPSAS